MLSTIKKSSPLLFYPFLFFGELLVVLVPPIIPLGLGYFDTTYYWKDSTTNTMLGTGIAFFISSMILRRFEQFPQKNSLAFVLPVSLTIYGLMIASLFIFRLSYSIQIIAFSLLITIVMLAVQHMFMSRTRHLNLFLVPPGGSFRF